MWLCVLKASSDLVQSFKTANDGSIRAIRVFIDGESLVETACIPSQADSTWEQDVPDHAKVRDKMLYAATKATLTKELGDSKFIDFMHTTHKDEVTLSGYEKHLKHKEAEAPLTEREIENEKVRQTEVGADIGTSTRRINATSIGLPISNAALDALTQYKESQINTAIFVIEGDTETIGIHEVKNAAKPSDLHDALEASQPCFLLYRTMDDGKSVFAYVCPPSSKVKSRMVYSSSKASFLQCCQTDYELSFELKVELDSMQELNDAYFKDQFGEASKPSQAPPKPAFAKPTRPGRR
ncbi:hypothetical protein HDU67_008854 [Dinochytrium kinnereticum]|nr:hypothetical protein HDU67_008854 [Dinochytrium kinnereticum]